MKKHIPVKKLVALCREIETRTVQSIECPTCGDVTESDDVSDMEFAHDIADDFVYASSEYYNAKGWICRRCFDNGSDDDGDWTEIEY